MSLKEMIEVYVENKNVCITSASGEGSSSVALYISMILSKNNTVMYYNSSHDIDRDYVKRFYPLSYKNVLFVQCDLSTFLELLEVIDYDIDYLVIDPADHLASTKVLPKLKQTLKNRKCNIIATSQLRLDPKKAWKPYSTMEELNKKSGNTIFDYSIWIRKATESNVVFTSKYIDVFKHRRIGNRFENRYTVRFDNIEGCIIT